MAIFLGDIASGVVAGFLATGLIVVFGEILPQAFFARYALDIGARSTWFVRLFPSLLVTRLWAAAMVVSLAV